jgi:hypothetical protein
MGDDKLLGADTPCCVACVIAYNLTRVMNIIGIQPLITAMRA